MPNRGLEQAYYTSFHQQHKPPYEIWNGGQDGLDKNLNAEVPKRAERIIAALRESNIVPLTDLKEILPEAELLAVHHPEYLAFLAEAAATYGPEEYHYPSVFGLRASDSYPTNFLGRLGHHSFDMYTPVSGTTFEAAQRSASLAWKVAEDLLAGKYRVGYALCRPPGHHAEKSQMGGYCYLNNAAIAADHLSHHGRVATLDVDFHHGNGTQHIFYDRDDVLTISIHAEPGAKFPYMSGYEEEIGVGAGEYFNVNYPLPLGTGNAEFQGILERACVAVSAFDPTFLVLSFGADTHITDPIGGFELTTDYFTKMGETISALNLPTAIIQEGGYNNDVLGTNVVSFLAGFK